jgi:pimeloyl-ACP methyl ester carboxylesterase
MHTFSKRSAVALIAAFLVTFAIAGLAQEQKFKTVPVKTTDGLTISPQDWGNPDGPEILFIHGLLARSSVLDQTDAVGIDCGLPEQLCAIDWRKQIGDTAVTFCALSGAADPSSVRANPRPPCDWHPGRSACSAG